MNRRTRLLVTTIALDAGAATVQIASPVAAADPPSVGNTGLVWNDAPIGVGSPRSVHVYNDYPTPLAITSSATAPTDAHFTVADGCNGVSLGTSYPTYSCEIVYTFTPDAA